MIKNIKFSSFKRIHCLWLVIVVASVSCESPASQRMEVVEFDALEMLMTRDSEKIEVINFWATWCAPCIKEIPYFEKLKVEKGEEYNVTLVSLDFADEFEKKVKPFVAKRELKSDILLLDEIDYNSWIDKVDPSWSGAIPATLIINHNSGKRKFVEKELEEGELESLIESVKN